MPIQASPEAPVQVSHEMKRPIGLEDTLRFSVLTTPEASELPDAVYYSRAG
jgi:hypothetical protein